MNAEIPEIVNNYRMSNSYSGDTIGVVTTTTTAGVGTNFNPFGLGIQDRCEASEDLLVREIEIAKKVSEREEQELANFFEKIEIAKKMREREEKEVANFQKRLVQVFIVDPDQQVPMDKSILYSGEQKLTDVTDQELFFEIPILDLLKKHNEEREKIVDKRNSGDRVVYLEPIRVNKLKMSVVEIAKF